jgi:3-polyprenyl-4-hydroxybenzoate decarboxylase
MSYVDLRDWLEDVKLHGELQQINGASWDLEMSGISEIVYREGKDPKPLLLFDNIPGYPRG